MPPFATIRLTAAPFRRAAINQQLETSHDLDHPPSLRSAFRFRNHDVHRRQVSHPAFAARPPGDDDQYSITGSGSGTAANGDQFNATIQTPLIRNLAPGCRGHFTQGTVLIQRTGRPDRLVDFGNGSCDDQAVVTINGHTHLIHLH